MKVLLVNYEYPPVGAGASTATRAIAQAMLSLGHSVVVLTTAFNDLIGTTTEDGIRVVRVASRRKCRESASIAEMLSFIANAGVAIRGVVQAEQIGGIIAFFSVPSGPLAFLAHKQTGIPYIISLRGGDVPGTEKGLNLVHHCLAPLRRHILRYARAVTANSSGLKDLSERADPTSVLVIPNGVDNAFFVPPSKLRDGNDPYRLLFIGRFQAQKNLFWLLDQLSTLRKYLGHSFILDLVGDGPQKGALAKRVRDTGLTDIVNFHGWKSPAELRDYYQTANFVINPSLYEGMPNVVLEAMACGRPVLASNVPGNDAVVDDEVTGFLFELGDKDTFLKRACALLQRPEIAASMGAAGRLRVEREFSWARTAESYLELLGTPSPFSSIP